MNFRESTSEFRSPNRLGYVTVTIKISEVTCLSEAGVFFEPNALCSQEEIALIKSLTQASLQEQAYNQMRHMQTFMHEGCRFGVKYALTVCNASIDMQKYKIIFGSIQGNCGTTHDMAAYATIKAIWLLFDFIPTREAEIYYSEERQRFIFPDAEKFPIGVWGRNDIIKMFKEAPISVLEESLEDFKRFEDEYFNR